MPRDACYGMILFLDADGVVLKRHRYFSERYAEERGVPPELVATFFKDSFVRCQMGQADLKEELLPHLAQWKWDGTVDDFLEYWFTHDTELDEEVLTKVSELRAAGVKCYLASGQEKYRAAYITKLLEGKLDGFFYSCDIGARKSEPAFFTTVLAQLGVDARDVVYLDNSESYVAAATSVGIDARLYQGPVSLAAL